MKNTIVSVSANIVVILTTTTYDAKGYGVKIYRRGDYRRAACLEDMPLYTNNVRVAFKRAIRVARIIDWRVNVDGAKDVYDALNGVCYTHAVWAAIEAKH